MHTYKRTQIDIQTPTQAQAQTYMTVNNSSFICFNKSSSSFRQKYVLIYRDGRLYININIQYNTIHNIREYTSCKSDLMFVKWKAFGLVWFGFTCAGLGCGVSVHGVIGDDVVFQIFGFHHIQSLSI